MQATAYIYFGTSVGNTVQKIGKKPPGKLKERLQIYLQRSKLRLTLMSQLTVGTHK